MRGDCLLPCRKPRMLPQIHRTAIIGLNRFIIRLVLPRHVIVSLIGVLVLAGTPIAAAPPLTVAAASDLQAALPRLTERFERETGVTVRLTFGSSGNFYTQIQNGAPFDLFFSADLEYPARLQSNGLVEPSDLYKYAVGKIVLWARAGTAIDVRRGLQVLVDPRVRHIAIANPEHAPYGRAAVAALQHEGLYERVRSKLVLGENISQAAQFVASGNAEAGIIALSLALAAALGETGSYFEVPTTFYPPLEQAVVVLRRSPNLVAARQLVAFVKRPESVRLLQELGFAAPPPQRSR